jgi:hypothetical protein
MLKECLVGGTGGVIQSRPADSLDCAVRRDLEYQIK